MVHRVLKRRTGTPPDKLVTQIMGYSSDKETVKRRGDPRLHGHEMEDKARQHYIEHMHDRGDHVTVSQHGLFVSAEHPYIGSSIDGMIHGTDKGPGVLEIKCPVSEQPIDVLAKKRKSFCLKLSDGHLQLKTSHMYYCQLHMEMAITGCSWANFVVFTASGTSTNIHIERVPFNEEYWKECLQKIESFYRSFVVLELVTRRLKRNISLLP